jgi:predicted small metal-binding protein
MISCEPPPRSIMITTTCKGCGTELTAESEEQLVSEVQEHIAEAHASAHSPSREQVLSVIRQRGVHES